MEWKNKAAIICKQTAWARVSGAERCRSSPVLAVFQQAVKTPCHMQGYTHTLIQMKTRRPCIEKLELREKNELFISGKI